MTSIIGALPWNLGAGCLFAREISSVIHLPNYKLLKSACMGWIETKGRFWKKLIFSVVNGRQVFPGLIQRIKVGFLLSCSLPSLLLGEVNGEKTNLTEVSAGESSFQGFLNLRAHFSACFSSAGTDQSVHISPPVPRYLTCFSLELRH